MKRSSNSGWGVLVALLLGLAANSASSAPAQLAPLDAQGRTTYLVEFDERGLIDEHRARRGTARGFDFQTAEIQASREAMAARQDRLVSSMSSLLGRSLMVSHRYFVTHSGIALRLTPEEAGRVRAMPDVTAIRRERIHELSTYRGPAFIGADAIWDGSATPDGSMLQGEETVIAVLDTGIPDSAHDSFANDPACGHGSTAPNKVLSSLDCSSTDGSGLCNGPEPGDTNGHGSHTASTAGGNRIDGSATPSPTIPGSFTEMSGVAPCAHIRAYKVCPGDSCPDSAILAGMQSVMIHGDVDSMNFSISGGTSPWADNDRVKLDLVDSGVFVAVSAGNTSLFVPDPVGNVNHLGPWVMAVAASTRDTNNSGTAAPGDVLASFSLRGPTPSPYDGIQKPDITGPGVDIYAAVPGGYDFYSGTSMSSPHVAGAGALVAQAHPDWTPMEIKSAMQMTAFTGGFQEDGSTAWTPDQVGNGRVELSRAALAGLVMDETTANFLAANPNDSGDPRTLNLPSMRHLDCTPSCTFTRTVRNTLTSPTDWSASGASADGDFTVEVAPATFSFTGDTSETQELSISVYPQGDTTGSIAFGAVTLSEDSGQAPDATMTIAMSGVGGPDIATSPASMSFNVAAGASDSDVLQIDNTGTQDLDWLIDEATPDARGESNRGVLPVTETLDIPGFTLNPSTPADFDVEAGLVNPGTVTGFTFEGEVTAIGSSDWASDMQMTVTAPDGPSFTVGGFDAPPADWDFQGGGSTNPGVYSSTHEDVFGAGGTSDAGTWNFAFAHDWSDGTDMTWEQVTVTLIKEQDVCQDITDITWLSLDATSGTVPAGDSDNVQVTVDATGLSAGSYQAQLCLTSNSINSPLVQVPISLQVTDPPEPDEAVLNGTLTSLGYCDGTASPVAGGDVEVVGQTTTFNATTDALGNYSVNIPESESPVDINVAPAGHVPQSVAGLVITAQQSYANDFDLRVDAPCAVASTTPIAVSLRPNETQVQNLELGNDGAAALSWSVDFDVSGAVPCEALPGLSWLSASPASDSLASDSSQTIGLTFDSTGQPGGLHEGSICLATDDADNALIVVPVQMTVEERVFRDRFEQQP